MSERASESTRRRTETPKGVTQPIAHTKKRVPKKSHPARSIPYLSISLSVYSSLSHLPFL